MQPVQISLNVELVFFVILTFLMIVVMLNLLIAIMSDTFDIVKDREVTEFYRERTALLAEQESVMRNPDTYAPPYPQFPKSRVVKRVREQRAVF